MRIRICVRIFEGHVVGRCDHMSEKPYNPLKDLPASALGFLDLFQYKG